MPRSSPSIDIVMEENPGSPLSDAYRTLRINIEFSTHGRELKTIAITSAQPGEGKTTTSLNLAVAYAQAGRKVILLDADLRKPSIHQAFGGYNNVGLTNFLSKQQHDMNGIIRDTGIDNLSVITSGPAHPNPSELIASERYDSLLSELKRSYDVILIDTPPLLALMDARITAVKSDGVLLVVQYRKVKRAIAKKVKEDLMKVNANVLGVVFNQMDSKEMVYNNY